MAQQTREERERAQSLKQLKQDSSKQKRDKIKQEFLRQQLARLKQAGGTAAAKGAREGA